jgi:hypothetical protein
VLTRRGINAVVTAIALGALGAALGVAGGCTPPRGESILTRPIEPAAGTRAATSEPTATTYVGRVSGTRALIGLVEDGGRVRAYVCDSRRIALWFSGSLRDARGGLPAIAGEGRLTLALVSGRAQGHVAIGARRHRFAARPAGGRAGLYRGTFSSRDGRSLVAGGVVLPSGAKAGAVVAAGTAAPLPVFTPPATIDRAVLLVRP